MIFKEGTIIRCIRSSGSDDQGVVGQLAIVTREIDTTNGSDCAGPWMKFLSANEFQDRHDLEERCLTASRFEKIT